MVGHVRSPSAGCPARPAGATPRGRSRCGGRRRGGRGAGERGRDAGPRPLRRVPALRQRRQSLEGAAAGVVPEHRPPAAAGGVPPPVGQRRGPVRDARNAAARHRVERRRRHAGPAHRPVHGPAHRPPQAPRARGAHLGGLRRLPHRARPQRPLRPRRRTPLPRQRPPGARRTRRAGVAPRPVRGTRRELLRPGERLPGPARPPHGPEGARDRPHPGPPRRQRPYGHAERRAPGAGLRVGGGPVPHGDGDHARGRAREVVLGERHPGRGSTPQPRGRRRRDRPLRRGARPLLVRL